MVSKVSRAMAIKQVGGRVLRTRKGKQYVQVGGGLFKYNEVVSARKRLARVKYGASRKTLKRSGL